MEATRRAAPVEAETDDWELLRGVASGDGCIFEELVIRHQGRVLRLCERLLLDRDLALDATQEVFLRLYRKAGTLTPRGQLSTWLYRVASNYCFNQLRRRKIVRFLSLQGVVDEPPTLLEPRDEAPDAVQQIESRERWAAVQNALKSLPPSQRVVLVMAKFEGMSYREIGEALELSRNAVESRLFRAMRKVERVLSEDLADLEGKGDLR